MCKSLWVCDMFLPFSSFSDSTFVLFFFKASFRKDGLVIISIKSAPPGLCFLYNFLIFFAFPDLY